MEDRGEAVSVELDAGRAAEVADQARRLGLRGVTVIEADAAEMASAAADSTGCSSDAPLLGSRCPRLASRRPLAQVAPQIERLVELQDRSCARRRRCCAGRRPSSTRPARSRAARTRTGSRALLAASAAAELPGLSVEDLCERAPDLASFHDPRCLQVRPDRDRTTGFFVCRLKRDD
jgi:hypothetical protein